MEAIIHADIQTRAEGGGEGEEAPLPLTGVPTEEQVAQINGRHSRAPLPAEDLYVFRARVSSSDLDDYMTWFDPSSLANFDRAVNTAGVPLLRQHSWMAGVDADFPLGRFFHSELVDAKVTPARRPVPFARDALGRAPEGGQDVLQWAYIDRRGTARGEPNTTLIRALDSGVLRAVSVGATLSLVAAPGADCLSDIDGKSLLRMDEQGSDYFPGLVYEVDGKQMIATARYVGAVEIEASLVTLPGNARAEVLRAGSTVAALHRKAQSLYNRGRFDAIELEEVEDRLGAIVRDRRSFSAPAAPAPIPAPTPAPAEPPAAAGPAPAPAGRDYRALLQERAGEAVAMRLALYAQAGASEADAAVLLLLDHMEGQAQAAAAARQSSRDITDQVCEALGLEGPADLAVALARLPERLARADRHRKALEDAYIRAYVRAHDVAEEGFDEAAIRRRIAGWSEEDLSHETDSLARLAKAQFAPAAKSRPAPTARPLPGPDGQPARAARAPRASDNPALYRS